MNRVNYYNYIEEKLHTLAQRINTGGKLNMLSLHLHSESFYQHFFNLLYGYHLTNLNQESQNVEAIDLIDRENKIIIQVSSTSTKSKIEGALAKKSLADYSDYTFKFISIAKDAANLRKNSYKNPHSIQFNPTIDIYDIASLLNEIKDFDIERLKIVYDFIENELGESSSKPNPNLTIKSSTNDSSFIGREDEIKAIDKMLESSNSLLLINGIGGIGKSSLANHYLYIRENKFDYYGFIEGLDSFISEFRNSLDLKAQKEEELYREIISKLQGLKGNKLLVIDNVEDMESHQELMLMILSLKKYDYKILFTSRRKIKHVKSYLLGTLLPADAQNLFLNCFKKEEREKINKSKVDKIINYLGLHTLFIKLVAETVEKEGYTLDDILEKFKKGEFSKIEFIDEESGDEVTFNQNLQELFTMQNLKNEYILLLKQLAVLPSIDIELSFLEEILGKERLKGRINFLVGRGWLIENEGRYKLHQIIKEFLLANYAPCFEDIKDVLNYLNTLISKSADPQTVVAVKDKLIYFKSSIDAIEHLEIENEKIGDFYNNIGNIYLHLADYEEALSLTKKSLKIRKFFLKDDDIKLATSYSNLGECYRIIGRMEYALTAYLEAIKIGKSDEENCITYDNLAGIYQSLGDKKNSILFMDKSLSSKINIFGENDLLVIVQYTNFAGLYLEQNEYQNALNYFNKALTIAEKVLDENHLDKANIYMGLSLVYFNINNYETAYTYLKKTLEIREKNLPSEHPELLAVKDALNVVKQKLNIVDKDK